MTRVKSEEVGVKEMYDFYKESTPKGRQVTFIVFKKIFYLQNKKISAKVLNGSMYKVPYRLGYLFIRKRKMNYNIKRFDFNTYKLTGIKCNFTNLHSDDYIAKWFWYKSLTRVKGKKAFCFQASRENKRGLAKKMKENHRQFLER